jgi:spore coat protein U-like protein
VELLVKFVTIISSTIAALVVAVVLAFVAAERAEAFTSSSSFGLAVAVNVRCAIAAGGLNFGSAYVSGQAAPVDGAAQVVVVCDEGRRVSLKMGQGLHPAPGSTDNNPLRRMRNGSYYATYQLYEDAVHTLIWDNRGNDVKTTRVFPYTATVYGRIPGLQTVSPGVYSDTIVATVHF